MPLSLALALLLFSPANPFVGANREPIFLVDSSQRLESYVGKYPSELLKGQPEIKRRLRTLLGADYTAFMTRLQTEMPIENVEGALVARGCMAHNCGLEEAVLVVNLADGKLHCGILSAKYGGKYKVFSEDKSHIPVALTKAMQQQQ